MTGDTPGAGLRDHAFQPHGLGHFKEFHRSKSWRGMARQTVNTCNHRDPKQGSST